MTHDHYISQVIVFC